MSSKKTTLNIALVQMNSSEDIDDNFEKAVDALKYINKESQIDVVVFPENFLYFGSKPNQSLCKKMQWCLNEFQCFAKSLKINLVLGTIPVPLTSHGKYYSRSYLISASGESLAYYDKRHLFDVEVDDGYGSYRESDTYEPGNQVVVSELEGTNAKLGLSICFDLRFSDHFLALTQKGANVLVVPSAFTYVTGQAHWEILLRARAIETQSYVLACNQVGSHSKDRETFGHSMIVDPWGRVIANAGDSEGVCYGSIDLSDVSRFRKKMPLVR